MPGMDHTLRLGLDIMEKDSLHLMLGLDRMESLALILKVAWSGLMEIEGSLCMQMEDMDHIGRA